MGARHGLWLGAEMIDPPEWHWNSSGIPLDEDFPWGDCKPIGTYKNLRRECLNLIIDTSEVCMYSDTHCDSKHGYVCEEILQDKKVECLLPFFHFEGACILFLEQRLTWNQAGRRCSGMDGRLFQPNNPLKFLEYVTNRYHIPSHQRGFWLGASLEKRIWAYTGSGIVVPHNFPWGKHDKDPLGREEHCLRIYAKSGMPFTYDDAHCDAQQFYVCESEDCNPPYVIFEKRCLLVIQERRTWQEAQTSCEQDYNGRLAEVKDPELFRQFMHDNYCAKFLGAPMFGTLSKFILEKKVVITRRVANDSCPPTVQYDSEYAQHEYWLGAKAKKFLWRWKATGKALPADFPWGKGEPSGKYQGYSEKCLNIWSNSIYSWKYNDAPCENKFFLVCEIMATVPASNLLNDSSSMLLNDDPNEEDIASGNNSNKRP
ncbi:unnamed protein product, partial [Meganyctiphanes norvegica]